MTIHNPMPNRELYQYFTIEELKALYERYSKAVEIFERNNPTLAPEKEDSYNLMLDRLEAIEEVQAEKLNIINERIQPWEDPENTQPNE